MTLTLPLHHPQLQGRLSCLWQAGLLLLALWVWGLMAGGGGVGIHTDISGSPLAATNAAGNVVWKENYSAYGERQLGTTTAANQSQWFHGKEVDASTGLQYFGARYYDPAVGRFMGIDPVGFQEDNLHSFNRYAYGNNNPVRYLDPDGRSPLDVGFLLWDIGKLGLAVYSGNGAMIGEAAADVFISTVGLVSPVPGTGLAIKAGRAADKASDVVKAGKGIGRPHGHHSDPKFLGGADKQDLTILDAETHKLLHKDMNEFLRSRTNKFGQHMRPQRGNSGENIQQNFGREKCVQALCDFYRGPGSKYENAAKDFFKQHPGRE